MVGLYNIVVDGIVVNSNNSSTQKVQPLLLINVLSIFFKHLVDGNPGVK
jgi:hypothetical protein